jgi:hypothetical protein
VWAAVVTWLSGLGIRVGGAVDVEFITLGGPGYGGLPGMPDRVAVVVPVRGGGLVMEGVLDRPEFDLLIRGPQGDPAEAEAMAVAADRLILGAAVPVLLADGTWLAAVDRPGGGPSPVERGVDGDRATYQATYTLQIDAELGG